MKQLFTSESVTEGHPDKLADQISDAIVDACLAQDLTSHVAVETLLTTGQVHVAGEITTTARIDIPAIARKTILAIGYDSSAKRFDGETCAVTVSVGAQSPDVADAVADSGAGDQGMMFGYACRETPELMPLPITLANRLAYRLAEVRHAGALPYLYPDGKTQVTIEYDGDTPVRLDTVVVSSQHAQGIKVDPADIRALVVEPAIKDVTIDTTGYRLVVNPGAFNVGGPMGDAGLTGRKIIADTYGGSARHGGGAFSGKDPTKVDRSGAYALRWIAKNVVAANLADRCEIQVGYILGRIDPVSFYVDCFGTEHVSLARIRAAILRTFDLHPAEIIKALGLLRPIYAQTAAYGHFGRDAFTWERTDRTEALRA